MQRVVGEGTAMHSPDLASWNLSFYTRHSDAQESLIHTITYRWDWEVFALGYVYWRYEDGSEPGQGKLNRLVVEN